MAQYKMRMVFVGAVYMDTIWTVPKFPEEDTKMRAQRVERRRGGNIGNTLEVLIDILKHVSEKLLEKEDDFAPISLHLIAVLPDRNSQDTKRIVDTLPGVQCQDLSRDGFEAAASSMIIRSEETGSRTIISHSNNLPEMTHADFLHAIPKFSTEEGPNKCWYHFEGRNPTVTYECVTKLRARGIKDELLISVECEKPERVGMAEVAKHANVVFYSKLWAKAHNFGNPKNFLRSLVQAGGFVRESVLLICTWGDLGVTAVDFNRVTGVQKWAGCSAWQPRSTEQIKVVDTIGAGDTFIAGMLFGLAFYPNSQLQHKLRYAVEIASRKVYQEGFRDLGKVNFESGEGGWSIAPSGLGSTEDKS